MAEWWLIKVEEDVVRVADGTILNPNHRYPMGLGQVEVRKTKKAGLHIVRFTEKGRVKYALSLKKGEQYKLGPKYGHRFISPAEEKDPIRRVLRLMDIPMSKLDFREGDAPSSRFKIETEEVDHNTYIGVYVAKVSVWPDCDPGELANAIAPIVFGEGADRDFPAALKSAEAAQKWIAARFQIEFPEEPVYRDAIVIVNGSVVILPGGGTFGGGSYSSLGPVHSLVSRFGPEVLGNLPSQTRLYIEATRDINKAVEWIFSRYRVVGIKKGDQVCVRFARLDTPEQLACVNSVYFNDVGGRCDQGLDRILREYSAHGRLGDKIIPLLFLRATESEELVGSYFIDGGRMADRGYAGISHVSSVRNGFVVHFYNPMHGDNTPKAFFRKEDAVLLRKQEIESLLENCCLLSPDPVTVGPFHTPVPGPKQGEAGNPFEVIRNAKQPFGSHGSPQISAILRDGDPFFVPDTNQDDSHMLIPIRVGETKKLIFKMSHEWVHRHNWSVWGVSVTRAKEGVEFHSFDPSCVYHWDEEGNVKK